jgi:hypothetical protein
MPITRICADGTCQDTISPPMPRGTTWSIRCIITTENLSKPIFTKESRVGLGSHAVHMQCILLFLLARLPMNFT